MHPQPLRSLAAGKAEPFFLFLPQTVFSNGYAKERKK
jgi:hypothetical protein